MPTFKHVVGVVEDDEALDLSSGDKADASTGRLPCEDRDPSCVRRVSPSVEVGTAPLPCIHVIKIRIFGGENRAVH